MRHLFALIIILNLFSCATTSKITNNALSGKESAKAIMNIIDNYFKPFTHSGFPIQPKYVTLNDTLMWREFKQIPRDSTNEIVRKNNVNTRLQLKLQYFDDEILNNFYTEKVEFNQSKTKDYRNFKYLFSPIYKINNNMYLVQCLFYSFEVNVEHILILKKESGEYYVNNNLINRAVFF
jgi:hypothetical protein